MNFPGVITSSVILVVCILLAGAVAYYVYESNKTLRWKVTSAKILEKRSEKSSDGEGGFDYFPVIKYEYEFNGKHYVGDQVNYNSSPGFKTEKRSNEFIRKIAPNLDATIWVNQRKPNESVLVKGPVIGFLLILPFTLLGIIITSTLLMQECSARH